VYFSQDIVPIIQLVRCTQLNKHRGAKKERRIYAREGRVPANDERDLVSFYRIERSDNESKRGIYWIVLVYVGVSKLLPLTIVKDFIPY
jgi:hypothetical protein